MRDFLVFSFLFKDNNLKKQKSLNNVNKISKNIIFYKYIFL